MEFSIPLQTEKKQRMFIDYLNPLLRDILGGCFGCSGASTVPFRQTINGGIAIAGSFVPVEITVELQEHCVYIGLEIVDASCDIHEISIREKIQSIIQDSLAYALSERKRIIYTRYNLPYIGPALDGEYFINGMRIAPLFPDDKLKDNVDMERLLAIDIKTIAIDHYDAHSKSTQAVMQFAAQISLFLNIGIYFPAHESRFGYVDLINDHFSNPQRFQLNTGYLASTIGQLPKHGTLCPPGKYAGSFQRHYRMVGMLNMPTDVRRLYNSLKRQPESLQIAFDKCSRLNHVACIIGMLAPSAALAYRIAAIDAASKYTVNCRDPRKFIKQYTDNSSDRDRLIKRMWDNYRSGHFHEGAFLLGEYDVPDWHGPIVMGSYLTRTTEEGDIAEMIRSALKNWLQAIADDNIP